MDTVRHLGLLCLLLGVLAMVSPLAQATEAFSGAEVYAQSCAMCHANGVGGAPRFDDAAAWRQRRQAGRANLLRAVLRGKGGMPPKGGNASLSLTEANAALDYMLSVNSRE